MSPILKIYNSIHKLKTPTLLRMSSSFQTILKDKAFIDGQWVNSKSGETFSVFNPATGAEISKVADMNEGDVDVAIQAAHRAFQDWRKTTVRERSHILRRFYNAMLEQSDELAAMITAENGKTLADAQGEVVYAANYFDWFSEEARRIHGEVISSPVNTKKMLTIRQPVGVVGMISPWNFPIAMLARKIGAALAAGCTVVGKPAEDTPLSALVLADIGSRVGLPPGVLNMVPCSRQNAAAVGQALCGSPLVRLISFTGSTATGKLLMKQSADTVKHTAMELGGNAPFIVFESADIETAVKGAMASKFRCSGQTCVCANRMIVHEKVHDIFVKRLVEETSKLVMGDGTKKGVDQGPLINKAAGDKVERIVKESVSQGAKVMIGGSRKGDTFFEPTVLTDVRPDMPCVKEEIFGPVAPVIKFSTEDEAVAIANSASVGLAGYFFTGDLSQAWRVAELLEVGMVGVNEGLVSAVEAPFGGVKESGMGREGSTHGIDEYMDVKYVCMGNLKL